MALVVAIACGRAYASAPLYRSYGDGLARAHVLLGKAISSISWSSVDPLLIIGDAGAVPYFSGMKTIDSYGLNDPVIARNFRMDRSSYILSMEPQLIVLASKRADGFKSPLFYEGSLYKACVESGYNRSVTFPFARDYHLWVMWRGGGADSSTIEKALLPASMRSKAIFQQALARGE